jgi:signal transduction histidine kinase
MILPRSNALHRGKAYRQLTYSAVSNLIQNALKYTHAGGGSQALGKFG